MRREPLNPKPQTQGPFRGLRVKLGFDPRQDRTTLNMQAINFRIPAEFAIAAKIPQPLQVSMPAGQIHHFARLEIRV